MKWFLRILIGLVIIAAAGGLFYKFVINKDVSNLKDTKSDFTITMQDLMSEASANDSLAKSKYIGKVLSITGNVKEIIESDSATVINLGDTTSKSSIKCQIDKRNNDLAKLVKLNTTVTIKGKMAGINNQNTDPIFADIEGIDLGTDIVMNYCFIEKK